MKASLVVVLVACADSPARTHEPVPQRVVAIDATTDAPVDALVIAPDAAVPAVVAPRAPGVYPVLVVLELIDRAPNAYVLACARVANGSPPMLVAGSGCAPWLRGVPLELIGDGARAPVKGGAIGKGDTCPWNNGNLQSYVRVTGLPAELQRPAFVVGYGVTESTGGLDPAVRAAIEAKHPPIRGKKPERGPPTLHVVEQLDLDGDGSFEVITFDMGLVRLFRADGELIGSVGCASG